MDFMIQILIRCLRSGPRSFSQAEFLDDVWDIFESLAAFQSQWWLPLCQNQHLVLLEFLMTVKGTKFWRRTSDTSFWWLYRFPTKWIGLLVFYGDDPVGCVSRSEDLRSTYCYSLLYVKTHVRRLTCHSYWYANSDMCLSKLFCNRHMYP